MEAIAGTPFVGELSGTLMLIVLGNGVVANVLLEESKGKDSGWMVITTGWGLAVMVGVFTAIAFGSPGAHINPAVTLAYAVLDGEWSHVPSFVGAQTLGAFLGAVVVWLHYRPHWAPTADPDAKRAVFCTAPAIRSAPNNLLAEAVGTVVLVVGVAAITSPAVGTIATGLTPFLVGALVWGIGLSLGGPTGYAINPARDLGPRIAHAVLPVAGKGGSDWGYGWVPVVGPAAGGLAAAFVVGLMPAA